MKRTSPEVRAHRRARAAEFDEASLAVWALGGAEAWEEFVYKAPSWLRNVTCPGCSGKGFLLLGGAAAMRTQPAKPCSKCAGKGRVGRPPRPVKLSWADQMKFDIMGATSGRMSSKTPNPANIRPREYNGQVSIGIEHVAAAQQSPLMAIDYARLEAQLLAAGGKLPR